MGSGGSKSTTTTNVKTKAVVDVLVNNIMNCSGNQMMTQSFKIIGNYNVVGANGGIKQVQSLKLSTDCTNNAENVSNLQQAVKDAVQQAAQSNSVSFLGVLGKSESEVNYNLQNEIVQKINNSTITNMINTINATQEVLIQGNNNIVDRLEQSQTMSLVQSAAQKVVNQLASVQAIENSSNQTATAVQSNFVSDIVSSIFDGLTSMGIIWAVIFIVAMVVGGYVVINGGPIAGMLGLADDDDDADDTSNTGT